MELVYLGIVIFLFALSTFDLFVEVINEALPKPFTNKK